MVIVSGGYAGDVTPGEAWAMLREVPDAQIIDVRTRPEWTFVGVPDTSELGREVIPLEWQVFPTMGVDPDFAAKLEAELDRRGADKDAPLLFLCRSGVRSAAAANLMTQRGYTRALNISGGFEGGHDEHGHRGTREGWKAEGLAWRQG